MRGGTIKEEGGKTATFFPYAAFLRGRVEIVSNAWFRRSASHAYWLQLVARCCVVMAELPTKAELWRQLGYGSFRDWRLAKDKQRRDAAKAARINGSVPNGAAPSPAAVPTAPAPEAPTRKRRPNHSPSKTDVLLAWFDEHVEDPYPSPNAKRALASNAGLDVAQVETCAPLPSARASPARARAPHALTRAPPRAAQGSRIEGSADGDTSTTTRRQRTLCHSGSGTCRV